MGSKVSTVIVSLAILISPVLCTAQTLGEALDAPAFTWQTGGDADWFGQGEVSLMGGDAARTGPVGHDQLTYLETTVSGRGAVYFYWKASTEEWVDYLNFFVDGNYAMSISGQEGWWQGYWYLDTDGDHTLTWVYEKDEEDIEGDDAAWVDGFSFVPGPPSPVPLAEALDAPGYTWQTGGAADWHGRSWPSAVGGGAAQAGAVGDGQTSSLWTEVPGRGTVRFSWKASSEWARDNLEFSTGRKNILRIIMGEAGWREEAVYFNKNGPRPIRWSYRKDSNGRAGGADTGWVDDFSFDPAPPPPRIKTITSPDSGLWDVSMVIGADGLPVIAHTDWGGLNVLKCGDTACSSGNIASLADYDVDEMDQFFETSMALGSDGLPVMAYQFWADELENPSLNFIKCGNSACSSGNTRTVLDSTGDVGYANSMIIGSDGYPVIAYYHSRGWNDADLKVVKCGDLSCSSGNTFTVVESGCEPGYDTSMVLGGDGLPVIAYYDYIRQDLRVVKCGDLSCSSGNTFTTVDDIEDAGEYLSMAMGSDGLPVIAYRVQDIDYESPSLKVLKCGDAACSSGNIVSVVNSLSPFGDYGAPSLAVPSDGLPLIAYFTTKAENVGTLKLVRCGDLSCSSGNSIMTIREKNWWYPGYSLAMGSDGLPVIACSVPVDSVIKVVRAETAAPVFHDDFHDGFGAGDPHWTEVSGNWKVSKDSGTYYSSKNGKNLAVVKDPDAFSAGILQTRFKLTGDGTGRPKASIVFGYQDGSLYRRVTVKRRKVLIAQKGDYGGETRGRKAVQTIPPLKRKSWHDLRIEIHPSGRVEAYLDFSAAPLVSYNFAQPAAGMMGCRALKTKTLLKDYVVWDETVLP